KNSFFLPYRSDNLPAIGVITANPNVYKVIPQVPVDAQTPNEEFIVVSAALIMPLSNAAINTPIIKIIKLIFNFVVACCFPSNNILLPYINLKQSKSTANVLYLSCI